MSEKSTTTLDAAQAELLREANVRRQKALRDFNLAESLKELYREKRDSALKHLNSCRECLTNSNDLAVVNRGASAINNGRFGTGREELETPFTGGKEADDENRS